MTLLIIIVALLLLFGGFGHTYTPRAGVYPYRTYALPSVGVIVVVLVILYVTGVVHL